MSTPLDGIRSLLHQGVDYGELRAFLWRSRRTATLTTFLPMVVAVGAAMVLPRWYGSGATLTVDTGTPIPSGSSVLGIASQLGLAGGAASTSPQFYADLFGSRLLLERVLAAPFPLGPGSALKS